MKNTLGPELMNERDLPGFLHTFFTSFEAVGQALAVPLELGRHLVCGAVDHARRLGVEPAPDFGDTAGHLGEWTETSKITFGRDGVPFYVSGPYDNPRSVVRTLDRTCGEGNYDYVPRRGLSNCRPCAILRRAQMLASSGTRRYFIQDPATAA